MLSVYGVLSAHAAQAQGQAPARAPTAAASAPAPAIPAPSTQAVNYSVRIDAPGKLDDLLEDNLDLLRWRGNPRVDLDQLQRLVKAVPEEAKTLIATEGYYSPKITAGLDTSGGNPVARIVVDPGQPTLVSDLDLVLQGFVPFDQGGAPYDAGRCAAGRCRSAPASASPTGKPPSAICCAKWCSRASRAPSWSKPAPRSTPTPIRHRCAS